MGSFAVNPVSVSCRENVTQSGLAKAREEARVMGKDPLLTVDFVKLSFDKYAVYVRKLEGT